MELLLVASGRLKIVMSSRDMQEYAITCEGLGQKDGNTKQVLRSILAKARDEVGFVTVGNRVTVQMYPSKDGGCEMYVTKSTATPLPVPLHSGMRRIPNVFRFGGMQNMLCACRKLSDRDDILSSAAYLGNDGKECYLLLYTPALDAFGREPLLFSAANEYGKLWNTAYAIAYLKEHCECICPTDAVKTLGTLA